MILSPSKDYTVFENNPPTVIFNCSANGSAVVWTVDNNDTNSEYVLEKGIKVVSSPPIAGFRISSKLIIPNTYINNNTEVICKVVDNATAQIQLSMPVVLSIQGRNTKLKLRLVQCKIYLQVLHFTGLLHAPNAFNVTLSNNTCILSWGAPFSLDVTDYSPEIFYYILCINITIYGCLTIPSDPYCIFPRTCTSSVDLTDSSSLDGTNGQGKAIMDYGIPIEFTFFAVNGAGNGNITANTFTVKRRTGLC